MTRNPHDPSCNVIPPAADEDALGLEQFLVADAEVLGTHGDGRDDRLLSFDIGSLHNAILPTFRCANGCAEFGKFDVDCLDRLGTRGHFDRRLPRWDGMDGSSEFDWPVVGIGLGQQIF